MAGLSEVQTTVRAAAASAPVAPDWDRFASWNRPIARLALALLAVLLVLAAWAPGMPAGPKDVPNVIPPPSDIAKSGAAPVSVADDDGKNNDLRLYRLIIERVKRGDDYYVAATELQRANDYPVAPGFTVRLPTLAYASAWLGRGGVATVFFGLLAAVMIANWRRFAAEHGGEQFRLFGTALLFVGLSTAVHLNFAVLHEVWAAEFMALSFGLHRPAQGKWVGAWLAAAAALSIREMALPFVLLMGAFALWRRNWREAAAWAVLVVLFAIGLAVHLHFAEAQIRPGDPVSPPWLVLGGLQGFLYKVIHSSSLNLLPMILAGPVAILALFGWTGWRSPEGSFASLLTLGYAAAFMIAGRDNNFYWGVMITPILFMGLAMAPFAAKSLLCSAGFGRAHG